MEEIRRKFLSIGNLDGTLLKESIDNSCNIADDIEKTINALKLQSLSVRTIDAIDSEELSTNRCLSSIRKKLRLKNKIKEKEIYAAKKRGEAGTNSFTKRVHQLATKNKHKEILEVLLNLRVILINEENICYEVVTMKLKYNEKLSVQELINRIPRHAKNPILAKQSYYAICLKNAFILEKSEPIQKYLFPSNEKQCVIAVPSGKTCRELLKLAKHISHNTRTMPSSSISGAKTSNRISITNTFNKNELPLPSEEEIKNGFDRNLPLLLRAAENDSSKSITNTTSTLINTTDIIYMIMALMFIIVTHNSSK